MSCNCKNKEYHSCQHGGECKCGGKCKEGFVNMAGQYDEHHIVGGIAFLTIGLTLYKKL